MRIIFVNGLLDGAKAGGAPVAMLNIASVLEKRGHMVNVVGADALPEDFYGLAFIRGVKLIHISFSWLVSLHPKDILSNWVQAAYLFRYVLNNNRLLKTLSADIIDNQGMWALNQDVLTVRYCVEGYCQKTRTKILPNSFWRGVAGLLDFKMWVLRSIEARYYREKRFRKIIAVSDKIKDELIKYHGVSPQAIEVIYNGFDHSKFNLKLREERRNWTRAKIGIRDDETVFILPGGNLSRKNAVLFCKVLEQFKERAVRLVIVGSKQGKAVMDLMSAELREKTICLGWVSDIENLYYASDVLFFPTIYEACAKVVPEAMACGLCVITNTESGCAPFIEQGVSGFCFEDNSTEAYVRTISELLVNTDRIKSIGVRAAKSVRLKSWEQVAEQYERVYESILESSK